MGSPRLSPVLVGTNLEHHTARNELCREEGFLGGSEPQSWVGKDETPPANSAPQ